MNLRHLCSMVLATPTVLLALAGPAPTHAAETTITDPLTGTTVATRRNGGELTPQGWKVTSKGTGIGQYLYYLLPAGVMRMPLLRFCLLTTAATALAVELVDGLEVDEAAMRRNLDSWTGSEQALALLTPRLGKHAAQAALHEALRDGRAAGRTLGDALRDLLPGAEQLVPDPGLAGEMVDLVVARGRAARAGEP